jgi:hypothetical protein
MPALEGLKPIAEALIRMLTFLFQVIFNHLEQGDGPEDFEVVVPEFSELMTELQAQRKMLEEVAEAIQFKGQGGSTGSSMPGPPTPSTPYSAVPGTPVAQLLHSGGGVNTPTPLTPRASNTPMTPMEFRADLRGAAGLVPNLTLWGAKEVTWGKKCLGKSYAAVYQTDPTYITWMMARQHSAAEEMRDFCKYVAQRRVAEQEVP